MERRSEAGQALVLTTVMLVALLASAGVAVDLGAYRYEKRLQQSAADAAAIAGASNLNYGGYSAAGQGAAAKDGFTDNSGNNISACQAANAAVGTICVVVNNPPSTGPHTGDLKYVEALVGEVHPTYFMQILKIPSETITARAVATIVPGGTPTGGAGCVYTLGPPVKRIEAGVTTSGSVTVQAPQCGILDNGNLIANGGANLSVTAGSIGVSGSYTNNGTGSITPTPVTGIPAAGDPVAITPPCSGSGCSGGGPVKITGGKCTGTGCANVTCTTGVCTMNAGTYSDICVDNNQTVIFNAGTYIINGSSTCSNATEFQVNAGSIICNTTSTSCSGMPQSANSGVTFYMTGSGSVSINGNATADFTAPNSGTYEGVLFYQDPSDTASASLSGTNTTVYQGALYFPTAQLSFGGNNSSTGTANFNGGAAYTLIVADWLIFAGNPTIVLNSNYSGLAGNGGPLNGVLYSARLVE